uniref:Peptide deformylase n=1 Tax=Chlamydomonas euryale TaxID=1486919 RepID=A0A7R9YZE9_9CHLO
MSLTLRAGTLLRARAASRPVRPGRAGSGWSRGVWARAGGFGAPQVSRDLKVPAKLPTVTQLEWSSPLEIVKYPDPRLRAVNAKVGVFDESLLRLAKEMIEVMYQDDGVGLAAPQVGINLRLMVFNPDGQGKPGNEAILCNPEIMSMGGQKVAMEEGCLSFPRIYGRVEVCFEDATDMLGPECFCMCLLHTNAIICVNKT